jgi:alkylation response protein AidB-like acyl-CoA dehydrogenase
MHTTLMDEQRVSNNEGGLLAVLSSQSIPLDDDAAVRQWLKSASDTFIPCQGNAVDVMFQNMYDILHAVGSYSVPIGIGLCMHYYVLASVATYPLPFFSASFFARRLLLKYIKDDRLIIANAGSVRTFVESTDQQQSLHIRNDTGRMTLHGAAQFMSLAGIADIVVLTATDSCNEQAVVCVPLRDTGISYGPISHDATLRDSRTRQIFFDGVPINPRHVFRGKSDTNAGVYQRTWFQGLLPAVYLGAAERLFKRLMHRAENKISTRRELTISSLDDFRATAARCLATLKTGRLISRGIGYQLLRCAHSQVALLDVCEASALAKLFVAEQVEPCLRTLLGYFGVEGVIDQDIQRTLQQLAFAGVQPMSTFDLYQYYGEELMAIQGVV